MKKILIIWGIAAAGFLLLSYVGRKNRNEENAAVTEKRRKTAGKTALILQIPAALLLILLFYTGCIPEGEDAILFGQIGGFVSAMLLGMIIAAEMIAGTLACMIERKRKWAFPAFMIWSLFAVISFFVFLFGHSHHGTRTVAFSDPNAEIIVSNWDFLLGGDSEIYEKTGLFRVRKLMIVTGDDGWTPLSHPEAHTLIDDGNQIIVHYRTNGWNTKFLRYENGQFVPESEYDSLTRAFQNGECRGGRSFLIDPADGKEYTDYNESAGLTVQPSDSDGAKMCCLFYRYKDGSGQFSVLKAVLGKMNSSGDVFEEHELSAFAPAGTEMNQGDRYYLNVPLTKDGKPLPAGEYYLKLYINDPKTPEETFGYKLVFTIR